MALPAIELVYVSGVKEVKGGDAMLDNDEQLIVGLGIGMIHFALRQGKGIY